MEIKNKNYGDSDNIVKVLQDISFDIQWNCQEMCSFASSSVM